MSLDEYRRLYPGLTVAEIAAWNRRFADEYPDQRHFVARLVPARGRVVELGGYDGALAAAKLRRSRAIDSWVNFDLVRVAQVCRDRRYRLVVDSERFAWTRPDWVGDTLVLSHVIEHLDETQAAALIDTFEGFATVYIDAPLLPRPGCDWYGSPTAHLLTWTWPELVERIPMRGRKAADTLYDGQAWVFTHAA